ncbi:T-cell surface antigen CD2 [Rhineura floridana]|uniref:T-cell surface antigen CD2 n=1 Tax=Rhineura floridana TaxID=261503 RepID=UPI002AC81B5A|nr:T-cell surface antigen CD2 [Rhineura floridana]XP_061485496.1 T-cell surface antigen CD2 [Rhineura floridana]
MNLSTIFLIISLMIFSFGLKEPLSQPQLIETCSNKTLICEVKSGKNQNIKFNMFENDKELTNFQHVYSNGIWRVTLRERKLLGKFSCKVDNGVSKQQTEKQINCSESAFHRRDMFVILCIGGGAVFIIALALLIYCIRKKRRERREVEAQERALLHARIVDDELKNRKLPQPPINAVPDQPHHHQMPPPPPSELQQQARPPLPRPRPH